MDEWMDGWIDRWMDGWIDGWIDRKIDGWMDRWMIDSTKPKDFFFTTINRMLLTWNIRNKIGRWKHQRPLAQLCPPCPSSSRHLCRLIQLVRLVDFHGKIPSKQMDDDWLHMEIYRV